MNITTLNAVDVLPQNALAEYEAGMGFFHIELVEMNVILYLVERIIDFPFDLFAPHPDETIFFSVVMRSFYDSVTLTITRLATDDASDLYTLLSFRSKVRILLKPEFQSAFDERLREARFDRGVKNLLERARRLRNNRIAHVTKAHIEGDITLSRPDLSEMKTLCEALNSLLDALSFSREHAMLPLPYSPHLVRSLGEEDKTDIEKLLDGLAKNSRMLNMPEQHPERWSRRRGHLTGEQIARLNHYRERLGLSRV